ncbi:MAG: SNF2-related protein [Pseudomonadales bacterium]
MLDNSFTKLVAHYDKLLPQEKLLLQLISVVYEPTNQTTLKKILHMVGETDKRFEGIDLLFDRGTKEKLQNRKLLQLRNGRLYCNLYVVEWLTLQAVDNGSYGNILDVALRYSPIIDNFGYRYSHFSADQTLRQLRYALHEGAEARVFELLDLDDWWDKPDRAVAECLVTICANPIHLNWFLGFPMELQYQVLQQIFERSSYDWSNQQAAFELLETLMLNMDDTNRVLPLLEMYYEQKFLRGHWLSLEQDLTRLASIPADCLLACLRFVQGDTSGSLVLFSSFITRMRASTRKRKIAVPGFQGVIYLLALLKDQSANNEALAKQQIAAIGREPMEDFHVVAMGLLTIVRDIKNGESSIHRALANYHYSHYSSFESILIGLTLLWNNESPEMAFVHRLEDEADRAEVAGYPWFAEQARQILSVFSSGEYKDHESLGVSLIEVLPRMENWELSLDALRKVSKTKKKEAEGIARLAWFLDESFGGLGFKGKEQKLRKNGSWSAGKIISLKRLAEESEKFPYLTDGDKKMIQCIERERSSDYYGYGKVTYSLANKEAMIAAVGHPALFLMKSPQSKIEFYEGNPELLVREKNGQLTISLEPYSESDDCLVFEELHGKYKIVHFTNEHLRIAKILDSGGLDVPLSAKDKVLESISAIAPLLTIHSDVAGVTETDAEKRDADPRLYIHLQAEDLGLRLSFHVQPLAKGPVLHPGRGGTSLFAEIEGKRVYTQRNLQAETDLMLSVTSACADLVEFAPGEWRWQGADEALEGLLKLQSMGDSIVLTWPEGKKIKLSRAIESSEITISLRQQTNWFELDGELRVDDDTVYSMQNLLELIKASSGRFIELGDGEFLTLTKELRLRLDEIGSYSHGGKVHALNASSLEESIEGMSIDADESWLSLRTRLQEVRELEPVLPNTLQVELRDYQLTGFQWLSRLAEWGAGACLADDMGLGKTVQALAVIVRRAQVGPTLVLAPTSVCTNWIEEANRFAPTLNPIFFGEGDRAKTLANLQPYDLLICSYGLLQVEIETIQEVNWTTIIADEAQAFKNPATKRSRAVMALKGDFKVIATGTPIENHLGELWNLFRFINPGLLGTREYFNEKFARPIENQKDDVASEGLRKLISPFILRRLKRDVLSELPPRTDITLHVDPSEEETALYEALRLEAVSQMKQSDLGSNQQRIRALASITKLRRAVCNPNMVLTGANMHSSKLEVLGNVLDELLENNHRALVFSQFVQHLSLIREYLDKRGITYQYLDGSTPTKKRTAAVHAFQNGESELFLISLKAGGIGLNLTAADYVIHMDPWWNPAVEDQASDRAHRIGQLRPVTVYRLVVNNTIEEKIVRLHAQKRDLADSLLEGSEVSGKMSLDDVLALLD